MARGDDEVYIYKVQRNDKIDDIIEGHYGVLRGAHLNAMRDHIGYLNRNQSAYTQRPGGIEVGSEPYQGEFLILPGEDTLTYYGFHTQNPRLEAFAYHPITALRNHNNDDLKLGFGLRADVNRLQEKMDPLMAIAFCEISDGICHLLSQNEKHREILRDYSVDYFKESGAKVAEKGAEFYASLNAVEKLLGKYSVATEKATRQELKKEIIHAHKEMTGQLSPLVKSWAKKFTNANQYKSFSSASKAMDVADLYARNGGPRPVILKKSFDRYLKVLKLGKYAPAIGTLADFVDANYAAYKDYQLHNGVWQKDLFKKDAGILPLVFVGEALGAMVIINGLPILLAATITVAAASLASNYVEYLAGLLYDRWVQ